jgi:hypothetical protein
MGRLFGFGRAAPSAPDRSADPVPAPTVQDSRPTRQLSGEELDEMLPQAQRDHATVEYRSEFEGLWTDRIDVDAVIERRIRSGQLDDADVELLQHWIERGYVILHGAVPVEVCEQVKADLERAFAQGDSRLHVLAPDEHFGRPLEPATDMRNMRVNDIYVHYDSARRALFAEPVQHFLRLLFDASPLLLQSLSFDSGSGQRCHRDTAYVVVDPPLALAASWLALEDVQPGSGELTYYEGSHKIPGLVFDGGYKCWNPGVHGVEAHDRFMAELVARSEAAGMPRRTLLAREGDVLIWSADLAHGGAPLVDESATRRSLVGHWCPDWAVPRYFDQFPDHAARRPYGGGWYASTHYAIDPAP